MTRLGCFTGGAPAAAAGANSRIVAKVNGAADLGNGSPAVAGPHVAIRRIFKRVRVSVRSTCMAP